MTTETKNDAVEYMNMLTRVNDPSKPLTYEEDLFRRIAWACDIIVERDEVITNLLAENERLREALKLSLNILEMADDYIPEEGYNAYLVALSAANTALEAGDE